MFGEIYLWYIRTADTLGKIFQFGHTNGCADNDRKSQNSRAESYEECDANATQYGNLYRGMGVVVGCIGAFVILLAIAPFGLARFKVEALFFGVAEAVLLAIMILVLAYGRITRVRQKWISYRQQAENKRYIKLDHDIERTKGDPSDANSAQLAKVIREIVVDQLAYNARKARTYHNVERLGNGLAWCSLLAALAGASLHIVFEITGFDASWLIFLTAFLPATAGIFHGVNGFLHIDELAEGHDLTYERLKEILQRLGKAGAKTTVKDMIALAVLTRTLLTTRDSEWARLAAKQDLKPL